MLKFYLNSGKPMTHHDDAVKVASDSYKVVLENDRYKSWKSESNRAQKWRCILILKV